MNKVSCDSLDFNSLAEEMLSTSTDRFSAMLSHMENQYQNLTNSGVAAIFQKSQARIKEIQQDALDQKTQQKLSKGNTHLFAKRFKSAEKQFLHVIKNTEKELHYLLAQSCLHKKDNFFLKNLYKGPIYLFCVRLFAFLKNETAQKALDAYDSSKEEMEDAAWFSEIIDTESLSLIERYRLDNPVRYQAGINGIADHYTFTPFVSKDQLKQQAKLFKIEWMDDQERKTIRKEIAITNGAGEENNLVIESTPLNQEFDQSTLVEEDFLSHPFKELAGNKGVTSTDHLQKHLMNAWEVRIEGEDRFNSFRSIRHGIISNRMEKNLKSRREKSLQAAEDLAKACLMQELKDKNLSLAEATEALSPLVINLTSLSLVTPEKMEVLIKKKEITEKKMLDDQMLAFTDLEKINHLDLGGYQIPVKIHVHKFNFGVNGMSRSFLKAGVKHQHEKYNQAALLSFNHSYENFKETVAHHLSFDDHPLTKEIAKLHQEINHLIETKDSYLDGDNPYEIGAKILIVHHLMNEILKEVNHALPFEEPLPGYHSAFNCKSGKDRTGMMVNVIAALTACASMNGGSYPSHDELKEGGIYHEQFTEALAAIVMESGGIEITKINTGAPGYKLSSQTARVAGLKEKKYDSLFLQMKGLSKAVSS